MTDIRLHHSPGWAGAAAAGRSGAPQLSATLVCISRSDGTSYSCSGEYPHRAGAVRLLPPPPHADACSGGPALGRTLVRHRLHHGGAGLQVQGLQHLSCQGAAPRLRTAAAEASAWALCCSRGLSWPGWRGVSKGAGPLPIMGAQGVCCEPLLEQAGSGPKGYQTRGVWLLWQCWSSTAGGPRAVHRSDVATQQEASAAGAWARTGCRAAEPALRCAQWHRHLLVHLLHQIQV